MRSDSRSPVHMHTTRGREWSLSHELLRGATHRPERVATASRSVLPKQLTELPQSRVAVQGVFWKQPPVTDVSTGVSPAGRCNANANYPVVRANFCRLVTSASISMAAQRMALLCARRGVRLFTDEEPALATGGAEMKLFVLRLETPVHTPGACWVLIKQLPSTRVLGRAHPACCKLTLSLIGLYWSPAPRLRPTGWH